MWAWIEAPRTTSNGWYLWVTGAIMLNALADLLR
jgi:hypothetical protein